MHSREHLETFRECAEATGIGLEWPSWRWSIEIGSKPYKELIKKKVITEEQIRKLLAAAGVVTHIKPNALDLQLQKAERANYGDGVQDGT